MVVMLNLMNVVYVMEVALLLTVTVKDILLIVKVIVVALQSVMCAMYVMVVVC